MAESYTSSAEDIARGPIFAHLTAQAIAWTERVFGNYANSELLPMLSVPIHDLC
jgi:hypothetical protein